MSRYYYVQVFAKKKERPVPDTQKYGLSEAFHLIMNERLAKACKFHIIAHLKGIFFIFQHKTPAKNRLPHQCAHWFAMTVKICIEKDLHITVEVLCSRYLSSQGSDGSAACGGTSDLSEWPRSTTDAGFQSQGRCRAPQQAARQVLSGSDPSAACSRYSGA